MIFLHGILFWYVRDRVLAGSPDFSIFYTAGLMVRQGQGRHLYRGDLQHSFQQQITKELGTRQGLLPYNHPPFEALFYVPLTYLSFSQAYFLMFVLNLLLLASSALIIRPYLPSLSALPPLLFLSPLAFFPAAFALLQGQDSILLLVIYCLAYRAFRRGHDWQAGIFLGLGLFKFHLVLPFAAILFLRRRWHALWGICLIACIECAVSWGVVGLEEMLYYPKYVLKINRELPVGVIVPQNMPNLRGLYTGWNWPSASLPWINFALLVGSLGLLLWACWQWRPEDLIDEQAWNIGFSLTLIATFLVGYHSYAYDMSILLLPILIGVDRMLRTSTRMDIPLKIFLGLTFLSPVYLILILRYSHQNLFALSLLLLSACLAGWFGAAVPATSEDISTARSTAQLL
jgi:Glycosyltransferase family 87